MRCSLRFVGLNVALSGTDLRGPEPNSQTTPSVRPSKWQLEHDCQPSEDRRSLLAVTCVGALLNSPRDDKNMSAPTATTSSGEPGAGDRPVRIAPMTRSLRRSTTDTVRESASAT